jgi:hypothetical protein
MKSLSWFVLGLLGGFIAAHFVNKNPAGHDLLAEFDARLGEFTDRMGDAYRSQEAKFAGVLDDAQDAASDAVDAVKDAASDAVDAAKKTASNLTD